MKRILSLALLLAAAATSAAQNPEAPPTRLGVKAFAVNGGGVKIAEVVPNSPAAEIGLKPGQIILVLGEKLVASPSDVRETLLAAGDEINIIYQDGGAFYQIRAPLIPAVAAYVNDQTNQTVTVTKLVPRGGKPTPRRVPDPRKR